MNTIEKYFPEGIASGKAFLNREAERSYLKKRIEANQHTILIAPRRYGKTSLALKVSKEMKMKHSNIDLLAAYNEEYVRNQIANKVSKLIIDILPKIKKAKEQFLSIFKHLRPEISIGALGQTIKFSYSDEPLQDITDLLIKLDETAQHFKKRAVIFLDEFQQLSQLKNFHSIEASIRHAVERSQNIAYVFSGSNRHMLKQMFSDQSRPLYKLCQVLTLERMEEDIYKQNLQSLAVKKWDSKIKKTAIEAIFKLTELHPFYMNALCQNIWQATPPSETKINEAWHDYVKNQRYTISQDINKLSPNQQKLLIALAKHEVREIQSAEFTRKLKISPSSVKQACNVLIENDIIYKNKAGYHKVLDPAVKYYLNQILWEV